jgi:hypothetical protein
MSASASGPAKSEGLRRHGLPQIWPHLSTSSRSWLMEHNGEPLPDDLIAEILRVTGGY